MIDVKELLSNIFFVNKFILIFFLIVLDFISKQWIFFSLDLNNFIRITSFFDLAHIHNFGISFGFFSGLYSPWIFIIIGIIITSLVFLMYFQSKKKLEKLGFLIIIAGALSNIFDRVINGFVIDFLYFHYKEFYWPAFNFADIYISIGVSIIAIQLLNDLQKRIKK